MIELAHELAQNWRTNGAAKDGSGPDCASLRIPLKGYPHSNRRSSHPGHPSPVRSRNRTGAKPARNWRGSDRFSPALGTA